MTVGHNEGLTVLTNTIAGGAISKILPSSACCTEMVEGGLMENLEAAGKN